MSTLGTMKERVADELARDDLTSQIATCISDAIAFYQDERFVFNESRDLTFSTVASQEFYDADDNANIPTLLYFDYLLLLNGSVQTQMRRADPIELELLNQNGTIEGQPWSFAYYNKSIRLGPVPDAAYTMRIAGQIKYAAPASDDEADNPWMTDAEKLIRSRAKYELALNYLRDVDLAQIMAAQVTEAFDSMKGAANRLLGTGVIKAMNL